MEIQIDGVTFKLIKKIWNGQYMLVQIRSEFEGITNLFYVYPSNSELGIWRLCSYKEDHIYKGHVTKELMDYTYDYVQSTLIHIKLQLFINYHIYNTNNFMFPLEQIPIYPDYDDYEPMISLPARQLHLPPFIKFQKLLECGELQSPYVMRIKHMFGDIENNPNSLISAFADQLSKQYTIDESSITEEGPYTNMFHYVIRISGVLKSVILFNREHRVKLYYLKLKFTEDIQERMKPKLTPEMITNIQRVCAMPVHFMPFLLTTPDATCNEFGLYNTYIPCGAFICKLFDYSTETSIQCSEEEIACGRVTPWYSYIGSRYNRIFPFVQLLEIDHMTPKVKQLRDSIRHIRQHRGGKKTRKSFPSRFSATRNRK